MIFRIDDVSANTNDDHFIQIVEVIRAKFPEAVIIAAVSPLVHDMTKEPERDRERAFPRKLSAMSDHRNLFRVQIMGMPMFERSDKFIVASHGLVHVDHRLLGLEAQEMSIVTSCSLLQTHIFVPPFNKWNGSTERICEEHGIVLVKFEGGWQHVKFNDFDPKHEKYYLHTHDTTAEWLEKWFG